jgi:hypothetical protein
MDAKEHITMEDKKPIWRKLPPVDVVAIEMTIGRNHLPIHGPITAKEFWRREQFLAENLLSFRR